MRTLSILALLITLAAPVALAQQRTVYGADGKAIARSTTDSAGTITTYDASSGKVISREAITRGGTTIYDAGTGRAIAKTTREQR
jgi:hypothetical protein